MTPSKAIKLECKLCKNLHQFECGSDLCRLANISHSFLKSIKAHCLSCVAEKSRQGIKECTGEILNPYPHKCPLHDYRLGHNPKRKGIGNPRVSKNTVQFTNSQHI